MEVLRDCQSPIEMNSFDVEVNSKSDGLTHEKQAMIPANSNENALLNNNNHSNAAAKSAHDEEEALGLFNHLVAFLCIIIMIITFPLSMLFCIKVTQEYERAVIFRLGRVLPGVAKGPGLLFVLPCIEDLAKVDLRTVTINIPPQEALTRDSVTVTVDAVVYFFIKDAKRSVTKIRNAAGSTKLLAQTTLRNMIGTKTLAEALLDRKDVSSQMQIILDEATTPWGVKVERVEIKDLRLPQHLQRSMAAEAEATREASAKVVAANGELKAAMSLKEASKIISESSAAIQLRVLQTLTTISTEKNSTVVVPLPTSFLSR
eukprot:Seg4069.1 transcript_id=Seg4069.1/GoldUCD/mRNA.D3Y31 product="Mechanosensory protein 2" protein_id=Seg4069.1/GoldUCD/D3Y31